MLLVASPMVMGAPPVKKPAPKATEEKSCEYKVSLFGNLPCLLTGPVACPTLQSIHSIGPEQVPAQPTAKQIKDINDALQKLKGAPSSLDVYQKRLKKRLAAQVAYADSIAAAKSKNDIEVLLKNTKEHISPTKLKDYETSIRKLVIKPTGPAWDSATLDQVREKYESLIEPYPEEEFHRAIKAANIKYNCDSDEPPAGSAEDLTGEE